MTMAKLRLLLLIYALSIITVGNVFSSGTHPGNLDPEEKVVDKAQQNTVTGVVVDDATGEPLIGITVLVKETFRGEISDVNGRFSINIPGESAVLVFSYVGYTTQEVAVSSGDDITVYMKVEALEMEEVVVVGYGVQKKESVVGSITQATGEQILNSVRGADLTTALTGNLPGLITIQNSGIPGGSGAEQAATQIFIRGRKTWNNSEPLILVDGIEREMADVDPYSVEGISVLKDASATAVFGVKGANGVILITTKRGQIGRPKLSFNATTSGKAVSRIEPVLGAYDALRLKNQVLLNEVSISEGSWPLMTPVEFMEYHRDQTYPDYFPDVNWRDEFLQDFAIDRNLNLTVSGGTRVVKYFGSLSYLNEGDVLKIEDYGQGYNPGFAFNRFNYRSNLDFTITPTTTFSVNLGGYFSTQKRPRQGLINQDWFILYGFPPDLIPPRYSDGTWSDFEDNRWKNYMVPANFTGYSLNKRTQVNTDFQLVQKLDFITKGLSAKAKLSYDITAATTGPNLVDNGIISKYIRAEIRDEIYPGITEAELRELEEQYTVWYQPSTGSTNQDWTPEPFTFGNENADSDANVNAFFRALNYELSLNYNRDFGKHNIGGLMLMSRNESARGSVFPSYREDWVGRLVYNYDSRYLFEVNGAYNGSEKFSKEYRFGFFPSFAAGWIISNESFFEPLTGIVNNLKIRATNGKVGSDAGIARWLYVPSYNVTNTTHEFGTPIPQSSPYPQRSEGVIPNADLQWETSEKTDIGVEAGLFNDMVTVNFAYFWEDRTNIFISGAERIAPDYFGAPPVAGNLGHVKNEGWEVESFFTKTFGNGFTLNLGYSFAVAKDIVVTKSDPQLAPDYQKEAGYPIGQPRMYLNQGGIINSWNQVYTGVLGQSNTDVLPGDARVIDFNSDGIITPDDQIPFGYTPRPQYTYSPQIGFNYKGLAMNVQFYGAYNLEGFIIEPGGLYAFYNNYSAVYAVHRDQSWNPISGNTGEEAIYSGVRVLSNRTTGMNYIDRNYLRLKNASISYTLNSKVVKSLGINSLRFLVSGDNLILWSDTPIDRESQDGFSFRGYPVLKRVTFGINLNF
jgi:TonB-linked SusC/RagA family outer membrane protein